MAESKLHRKWRCDPAAEIRHPQHRADRATRNHCHSFICNRVLYQQATAEVERTFAIVREDIAKLQLDITT